VEEITVELGQLLFPGVVNVAITSVEADAAEVLVAIRGTASGARRPGCGGWSDRIHGSYLRRPAHLPSAGQPVTLSLRVRRFVCPDGGCPQRIGWHGRKMAIKAVTRTDVLSAPELSGTAGAIRLEAVRRIVPGMRWMRSIEGRTRRSGRS
jgi:hypothetical protein